LFLQKSVLTNSVNNPFFAAPFGVLTYEWKNRGLSMRPVRDLFTWKHYREQDHSTLVATWRCGYRSWR